MLYQETGEILELLLYGRMGDRIVSLAQSSLLTLRKLSTTCTGIACVSLCLVHDELKCIRSYFGRHDKQRGEHTLNSEHPE